MNDVNEQGNTALMVASANGDYDNVKLLIDAGADMEIINNNLNAINIVIETISIYEEYVNNYPHYYRYHNCINLLVDAGADTNLISVVVHDYVRYEYSYSNYIKNKMGIVKEIHRIKGVNY